MAKKRPRREAAAEETHRDLKAVKAVAPRGAMEDDRPTEIYDAAARELHTSREQLIIGSTIGDMMRNEAHKLSPALQKLMEKARVDLAGARIDPRATLLLRHEFEFDRRIGYQLKLKLFDDGGRCVEVTADVDQDGRAIRRGSLISKLITI